MLSPANICTYLLTFVHVHAKLGLAMRVVITEMYDYGVRMHSEGWLIRLIRLCLSQPAQEEADMMGCACVCACLYG